MTLRIVLACMITGCLAVGATLLLDKNMPELILAFLCIIILSFFLAWAAMKPMHRTIERQKQFNGKIGHELRTPLAVVKMNTEVALLNAAETSKDELINTIKSNLEEIDRISEITQFLLTFSEHERKAQTFALTTIDLYAVTEKTCTLMRTFAEQRAITLTFAGQQNLHINGNAVALNEMLSNLIKNSIAYTPSPGSITVTVAKFDNKHATLTISDTGIGIPPNDLPHIFKPFYRGENAFSQRRKKRGTGIGLAVVKEVADFHHAAIFVESTLGSGTTFRIVFPLLQ
jgi:two-component system phosphate regulon sensor histidine kinase PhoR